MKYPRKQTLRLTLALARKLLASPNINRAIFHLHDSGASAIGLLFALLLIDDATALIGVDHRAIAESKLIGMNLTVIKLY